MQEVPTETLGLVVPSPSPPPPQDPLPPPHAVLPDEAPPPPIEKALPQHPPDVPPRDSQPIKTPSPGPSELALPARFNIVLPLLQKGWAKGSRLIFLTERLPDLKAALQQSKTKANDFIDATITTYFGIYPWDLPLDLEPLPPQLPMLPPVALTPYEEALKQATIKRMRKSITAWLEYRVKLPDKPNKKANAAPDAANPTLEMVSKLIGGTSSSPKLLCDWQLWSKDHFAPFKDQFEADFKKSGLPAATHKAPERVRFTMRKFAELPAEERLPWEEMAREAAAAKAEAVIQKKKDKKNAQTVLLSPQETQIGLDRIGNSMGPVVSTLAESYGMHVSLFVGGPEPGKNGQINVISIHHGVNKEGKTWANANKQSFKASVTRHLQAYLGTCYTTEEQQARALPATEDASATPSSSTLPSNSTTLPDTLITLASTSQSTPASPLNTVVELEATSKLAKSKGVKRKGAGKKRKRSKQNDSGSDAESDSDSSGSDNDGDNDHDSPLDPAMFHYVDQQGQIHSVLPYSAPKLGWKRYQEKTKPTNNHKKRSADDGNYVGKTSKKQRTSEKQRKPKRKRSEHRDVSHPPSPPPSPPHRSVSPPGSPPDTDTAVSPPGSPAASPRPHQLQADSVIDTNSTALWFSIAYTYLSAMNLGGEWDSVLSTFVQLERRSKFGNPKGPQAALGKEHRPEQIGWWIARAREPMAEVKKPDEFAAGWWAWWKGLQPEEREVSGVQGPLGLEHRREVADWSCLDKPGQNGFYAVLASLGWWGTAVQGATSGWDEWQRAVDDVSWVMTLLSGTPRSGDLNQSSSTNAGKKRRRG